MYQNTKTQNQLAVPLAETQTKSSHASKINTICDALLRGLQPRKSTNLQNIITAHVCKNPPALDDGLTLVADLMREDDDKLAENALEVIQTLGRLKPSSSKGTYIKSITLSSTMSPGVPVDSTVSSVSSAS